MIMKKLAIVLAALLLASVFVGCGTPAKELLNTAWEVKWGGNGSYSLLVFAEEDVVTYQDFDVSDISNSGSFVGTWEAVGTTVKIEIGVSALKGTWNVIIEENEDGVETLTLTNVEDDTLTHSFTKVAEAN